MLTKYYKPVLTIGRSCILYHKASAINLVFPDFTVRI
jgi:hypothetical protein